MSEVERLRAELSQALQRSSLMLDALDHIRKTARASRTNTRRLRWIEQRAAIAMKGEHYTDKSFDLVRFEENEHARLVRKGTEKARALRQAVNLLRQALSAINGTAGDDLDKVWADSDPESYAEYLALRAIAWPEGQGTPEEVR